jgi:hypothetical protein
VQASSVPCERLFSAAKEIADDRRSRLGNERFEELQMLKFAWNKSIVNLAAFNSNHVEEFDLEEFVEMLRVDQSDAEWDIDEDEIVDV